MALLLVTHMLSSKILTRKFVFWEHHFADCLRDIWLVIDTCYAQRELILQLYKFSMKTTALWLDERGRIMYILDSAVQTCCNRN